MHRAAVGRRALAVAQSVVPDDVRDPEPVAGEDAAPPRRKESESGSPGSLRLSNRSIDGKPSARACSRSSRLKPMIRVRVPECGRAGIIAD